MHYLFFNIIITFVFWCELQKVSCGDPQHLSKIHKIGSKDGHRNALTHKSIPKHVRVKSQNTTTYGMLPSKEAVTTGSWQKKPVARMRDANSMRERKHRANYASNSRRVTKMSVRQETNTDKEHMDKRLNPYSLEKQMHYIFSGYPTANVTKEIIGRTLEYNDILLFKMSESKESSRYFRADDSKYTDEILEKKIIFIVHGLSVMGMKTLNTLSYRTNLETLVSYYVQYLDIFDIFFIPMANPDGYTSYNVFWNKNMSPQSACPGVALDRNFDVAWNISGISISSCSHLYPGPYPFSEPETRAIREVFHRYSHRIIAYLHVHAGSYNADSFKGEAILYPRGYTDVQTDEDKYIDLKGEIDEAMKNASFQLISVTVDTLYNWYGKISGSSVDYASTVYGINYAMEFVMQLYNDDTYYKYSQYSLTEIWERIIDVTFMNIAKSLHSNEVI